jgi:hypothetical protein
LAATAIIYFFTIGEYLTVLACYLIRDYDKLYLILTGFLCFFPLYFWYKFLIRNNWLTACLTGFTISQKDPARIAPMAFIEWKIRAVHWRVETNRPIE